MLPLFLLSTITWYRIFYSSFFNWSVWVPFTILRRTFTDVYKRQSLSSEDIQLYLNRRKPGQSRFTTPRKEDDAVEILSGVFEGKTTGTPISLVVYNCNQKSKDYSEIAACYRPGHADYTFDAKYGFRDYRGGGRSSGRETIGRVAAGAVAAKILKELGITPVSYTHLDVYKSKGSKSTGCN